MKVNWLEIVAWIVAIAFLVLSAIFRKQVNQAKGVMKELAEAMSTTVQAMEDGKVTVEEAKKIVKEWKDVIDAFLKKKES